MVDRVRTILDFIRRCWGADSELVDCVSGMFGTHGAYFTGSGSLAVARFNVVFVCHKHFFRP